MHRGQPLRYTIEPNDNDPSVAPLLGDRVERAKGELIVVRKDTAQIGMRCQCLAHHPRAVRSRPYPLRLERQLDSRLALQQPVQRIVAEGSTTAELCHLAAPV